MSRTWWVFFISKGTIIEYLKGKCVPILSGNCIPVEIHIGQTDHISIRF